MDKELKLFKQSMNENEKSEKTIEKYMRDVLKFLHFLDKKELTQQITNEYKLWLLDRYAVRSVNSMIAGLNLYLNFIGRKELCVKQCRVQKSIYCPEESELTREEYLRLVKVAKNRGDQQLGLLIETICATGIRVGELKYITVEAIKKGRAVVSGKGKTRIVFIVGKLCKKLLKYAKRKRIFTGAVFVTKSGRPLDRSNIWRRMKQLCRASGVGGNKVFPHNLRHLFARTFYSLEKDIAALADILGHSSINTTRIYIISTGEEHRRKMERMRLIL